MADPARIADVLSAAQALLEGATLIYRHFGKEGRAAEAKALRHITFERRQQFLIGNDPDLAIEVGADGVHFRRDAAVRDPALWRTRCPDWLITMAGIKAGDYRGGLDVLDGLFVSPVFDSQSPSAGDPIGLKRFSNSVKTLKAPVFALGGITAANAHELAGSGAAGLAGISGFAPRT